MLYRFSLILLGFTPHGLLAQNTTCHNGGTLNDGFCVCAPNFHGNLCEEWNCFNGGVCRNFYCDADSIIGENRNGNSTSCRISSNCTTTGSMAAESFSHCVCPHGFEGKFCETETNCYYGTFDSLKNRCRCFEGFGGKLCKLYCQYGHLSPNGSFCICDDNAYGKNCEKNIVCKNGGKIIKNKEFKACTCSIDYYGDFCQYKLCRNGRWQNSTEKCRCFSGFTGNRCDQYLFQSPTVRTNVFLIGSIVFAIVLAITALCLFYFCFWRWRLLNRTDLSGRDVATRVQEVMAHTSRQQRLYHHPSACYIIPGPSADILQEEQADPPPPPYDIVSGKPPPYSEATRLNSAQSAP